MVGNQGCTVAKDSPNRQQNTTFPHWHTKAASQLRHRVDTGATTGQGCHQSRDLLQIETVEVAQV
jgi:hypothetical protein